MQLTVRTVLNRAHPLKSFVYADIRFVPRKLSQGRIEVQVKPRTNSRGCCPECQRRCPTYDHQFVREFKFIPLWGVLVRAFSLSWKPQ